MDEGEGNKKSTGILGAIAYNQLNEPYGITCDHCLEPFFSTVTLKQEVKIKIKNEEIKIDSYIPINDSYFDAALVPLEKFKCCLRVNNKNQKDQ